MHAPAIRDLYLGALLSSLLVQVCLCVCESDESSKNKPIFLTKSIPLVVYVYMGLISQIIRVGNGL
jgi:hypothetical protein